MNIALLTVDRYSKKSDWTIGKLLLDGKLDGYTVEDEIRAVKVFGETAIPAGTYELGTRQSPKFSSSFLWSPSKKILIETKEKAKYPSILDFSPHDLIWIKNVTTHQYVLIHWGNTDEDTDGCLIVGSAVGVIKTKKGNKEGVIGSRTYYKKLYSKIIERIKQGNQFIKIV